MCRCTDARKNAIKHSTISTEASSFSLRDWDGFDCDGNQRAECIRVVTRIFRGIDVLRDTPVLGRIVYVPLAEDFTVSNFHKDGLCAPA